MQPRFVQTISSLSSQRSGLSSSSFRILLRSSLNLRPAYHYPRPVTTRYRSDQADNQSRTPPADVKSQDPEPQDRGDTRPRPPELDLKAQNSEEMIELQKEQEIKEQQKKSGKSPKADILEEKEMSKAEQRKVNWGILKTLVKYIWPKVDIT